MVILDSIGDYYACAKVSNVPAPPSHAVNRGIMIEGLCTFISGTLGCGHATGTYGGNIGAIGLTKVHHSQNTDNPLYTDTRYNDNIRYNDKLTVTKTSLKR